MTTPTYEPVDEMPDRSPGRPSIWKDLVEDFLRSGHRYCKISLPAGRTASGVQASLHRTLHRDFDGIVACRMRGNEVYLERLTNGSEP